MNRNWKTRFLGQCAHQGQGSAGFTLIELLVVVIIIGILASIAYPSMLGQANKAKQAEAKMNIGAINRGQQMYFVASGIYASRLSELGMGIQAQTENYRYAIASKDGGESVANWAAPRKPTLRAYIGLAGTGLIDADWGEVLTITTVCESNKPIIPTDAELQNTAPNGGGVNIGCNQPPFNNYRGGFSSL
ncbi:type IV pilin-like G/H family protein [Spirulina subsalsa]|uniref:type IV pilin-like G/H family protein n=1 Tax=Spirulina subsalsa TaxID=54311 RepID=UPI0002D4F43C|nr:type IV pilin-like G/H family protein [Spirulina subsalsa]